MHSYRHNQHPLQHSLCASQATPPLALVPCSGIMRELARHACRAPRKIPRGPFKVLDAPALQDDFYLNLVDWSSQNVLAVGLGSCVYLWSACTCKVTKLTDLAPDDMVNSVSWSQRGTYLAVGTAHGHTKIFDISKLKCVRTMDGHRARVGTMAWNSHLLSTGSRDRLVLQRDVRVPEAFVQKCAPAPALLLPCAAVLPGDRGWARRCGLACVVHDC